MLCAAHYIEGGETISELIARVEGRKLLRGRQVKLAPVRLSRHRDPLALHAYAYVPAPLCELRCRAPSIRSFYPTSSVPTPGVWRQILASSSSSASHLKKKKKMIKHQISDISMKTLSNGTIQKYLAIDRCVPSFAHPKSPPVHPARPTASRPRAIASSSRTSYCASNMLV